MPKYRYPAVFPREAFVQAALERHFDKRGFVFDDAGTADLRCQNPQTGEKWIVEAKGETSDIGLDFRTGLGQLLRQIEDGNTFHAMAVPDTEKFLRQCRQLSPYVRETLNLHLLLVDRDMNIRVIGPREEL